MGRTRTRGTFARPRRCAGIFALLATLTGVALVACEPEKPPAPEQRPASDSPAQGQGGDATPETARLEADNDTVVLTFAGERGVFQDTNKIDDVPEEARGMVRVSLLGGPRPAPGTVWVANLKAADDAGGYPLTTVARDQYEELALGMGRSSQVTVPEGLEPPEVKPRESDVIVYKTDWCGVCKKLTAYLDRKGVQYVAKDIEKDRAAAAELQGKAKEHGFKMGSVPVVDVRGEMMVGFNRARLEQIL